MITQRELKKWVERGDARPDRTLRSWQSVGVLTTVRVAEPAGVNTRWVYDLPTYRTQENDGDHLWHPAAVRLSRAGDDDAYESGMWWKVEYAEIPYPALFGGPPGTTPQGGQVPPVGVPRGGSQAPPPAPAPAYTNQADLERAQRERPVTPALAAPPPGQVLDQAQAQLWYQQGYQESLRNAPPRADLGFMPLSTAPAGTAAYHYWQGYMAAVPTRPTTGAPPVVGPGLPMLNPAVGGYELYASVPLLAGLIELRGVPLNVAEGWGGIGFRPRFFLLGDRPGDSLKGFRLAGPGGAAVRAAQMQYPGQTPLQATGLVAWVAAMWTDEGILDSLLRKGAPAVGQIVLLTADQLRSYLAPAGAFF